MNCPRSSAAAEIPAAADGDRGRAGASHGLITRVDQLAARPGRQLTYSVG